MQFSSEQGGARAQKAKQVGVVLWLAFLSSTVLMVLVVHLSLSPRPTEPLDTPPSNSGLLQLLTLVLGIESCLLIGLSLWTRYRFLPMRIGKKRPEPAALVQGWTTTLVLAFALAEAIAINGVVLYILGGSLALAITFAGTAFFVLLVEAPRQNELADLFDQVRRLHPGSED